MSDKWLTTWSKHDPYTEYLENWTLTGDEEPSGFEEKRFRIFETQHQIIRF